MTMHSLSLAILLTNPDGSSMSPMDLFHAGKWIMWPMLLLSFIMLTVIIERVLFVIRENASRETEVVEKMLECVERRDIDGALELGRKSKDFVARVLIYSLTNRDYSMGNAFVRASGQELARYQQGMSMIDTGITAAPLLGLLGTVTGMMRTFGALGTGDVSGATATITGGVAEALIATMCGLGLAIMGLVPFNYLTAVSEQAKQDVADASHALEILTKKSETGAPLAG
jgi:biopolymer transport protein ExbB